MAGYDKYPVWSPDDPLDRLPLAWRTPGLRGSDKAAALMRYDCAHGERCSDLTAAFDYHATNVGWEGDDRTLWFIAPMEGTYATLPPRAAGPRRHVRHRRRADGRHAAATTTSTPSRWPAGRIAAEM